MAEKTELRPRSKSKSLLAPALILAASVAPFLIVLGNDFVRWDDDETIYHNPILRQPVFEAISHYFSHPYMHLWVPITQTTWVILWRISSRPWVFHLVSLLAHAAASLTAFALLKRLIPSTLYAGERVRVRGQSVQPRNSRDAAAATAPSPGLSPADGGEGQEGIRIVSALGAILFAVHPVQVETVAWASGLKDLLCGFFTLLAIWQYLLSFELRRGLHFSIATAAFVLAMLSKPTAMVAPLLAMAIDAILFRRPIRESVARLWPWFIFAIACAVVAKVVQPAADETPLMPFYLRPWVALDALTFYTFKLIWPAALAPDYGHTPDVAMRGIIAVLPPIVLAIAIWREAGRRPLLAAGAAIFVIGLCPIIGFVPFDFQAISTVADHYLYIPMFGVAMMAADLLRSLTPRAAKNLGAPVLLILAVRSGIQTTHWRDTFTLMTHTREVNPGSYVAENNMAAAFLDLHRPQLAEQHARASLEIKPQHARAMVTLGAALAAQNRLDEALAAYSAAAKIRPNDPRILGNLGGLLGQMNRLTEARECLDRAVALDPRDAQAHLNLGTLLAPTNLREAIGHVKTAIELEPGNLPARTNLGFMYLQDGDRSSAIAQFTAALRIDPNFPPAQQGLAMARGN